MRLRVWFLAVLFSSVCHAAPEVIEGRTVFYAVKVTKWQLPFIRDDGVSGPFEILNDREFMFISRCGTVSFVLRSTMQLEGQTELPHAAIYCGDKSAPPFAGVKGSLIDARAGVLYVSHHLEKSPGCIGMAVTAFELRRFVPADRAIQNPRRIFETSGCVERDKVIYTQGSGAFALNDRKLFFSIGDMGSLDASQDEGSDFGKIFEYDTAQRTVSRYAMGIRNTQGLAWLKAERVLIGTEHGPLGGDEINLIARGDNLGWSLSSYGLEYEHDGRTDYHHRWLANHDFGKKPAFVFMPAVAPTDLLIYPKSAAFRDWRGDAVFVSLKALSFFRARIEDGRIVYVEPLISAAERMRFVRVDAHGIIYAKGDPDRLVELRPMKH